MSDPPASEPERFAREAEARITANGRNEPLRAASQAWLELADAAKYEYNFTWLGLPIIQYPQDVLALQQIIWRTRPEVIIETGIARGGTTLLYASMLRLLGGRRHLVSIDIDIRAHNRSAIESHPVFDAREVTLLEGSSTEPRVVEQARTVAEGRDTLVCLDSDHSHDHVLEELRIYAPLVGRGSYVVVFDTSIATIEAEGYPGRPWGPGNNPRTAVNAFLEHNRRFVVDRTLDDALMISSAPRGFLRCIEDPS